MAGRLGKELGKLVVLGDTLLWPSLLSSFWLGERLSINGSELSYDLSMNVQWASHSQVKIGSTMIDSSQTAQRRPMKPVGFQFGVPGSSSMSTYETIHVMRLTFFSHRRKNPLPQKTSLKSVEGQRKD